MSWTAGCSRLKILLSGSTNEPQVSLIWCIEYFDVVMNKLGINVDVWQGCLPKWGTQMLSLPSETIHSVELGTPEEFWQSRDCLATPPWILLHELRTLTVHKLWYFVDFKESTGSSIKAHPAASNSPVPFPLTDWWIELPKVDDNNCTEAYRIAPNKRFFLLVSPSCYD